MDDQAVIDALKVAYWNNNIQSVKNDPCIVDAMTDQAIRQIKSLPSVQPEIIRCKDCKHFELNHFEKVDGFPIPIVVHEICMKWGKGCKTSIDGWCFMAERRTA